MESKGRDELRSPRCPSGVAGGHSSELSKVLVATFRGSTTHHPSQRWTHVRARCWTHRPGTWTAKIVTKEQLPHRVASLKGFF